MRKLALLFLALASVAGAQGKDAKKSDASYATYFQSDCMNVHGQPPPACMKDIPASYFTVTVPKDAPQAPVNAACPGSQTAPHCFIGNWVAPTLHSDNTPITGSLTYDLLRATVTNGVVGAFAPVLTGISGLTGEDDTVIGGQTYVYELIAHEAANPLPSVPSAASVAFVIPQAPPNPPLAVTGTPH